MSLSNKIRNLREAFKLARRFPLEDIHLQSTQGGGDFHCPNENGKRFLTSWPGC